jgi:hypothetical protein
MLVIESGAQSLFRSSACSERIFFPFLLRFPPFPSPLNPVFFPFLVSFVFFYA